MSKYRMIIAWSDEDQCYLVSLPEFPGHPWRTHGDTYEEAARNGIEVIESLVLAYETTGEPLPMPHLAETGTLAHT